MKIKELKELLNNFPDDMEIILSSDAEGNKYSPLAKDYCINVYVPDTTYYGDVWHNDDLKEEGLENEKKSLILYPVN